MQPAPAPERVLRFEGFELDLRAGELSRNGRRIRLQLQPFRILEILLEQPGRLVTREEFRERLWSKDTFVDFDHSLNTAVKKLREALSDEADKPSFIETLPRRGYRFIGTIDQTAIASPTPHETQSREPQPRSHEAAPPEMIGKVFTVCGEAGAHFAVAPVDEATLQEKKRLEAADDSLGLSLLSASAKILLVEQGTSVKILGARPGQPHCEVRVLEGEHIGQTVLIERTCLTEPD